MKLLSRVRLFAVPWTVAYQAPPSMEFSRQDYWSGLPFPSPGDLPNQGTELASPALQEDSLLLSHWGSPSDTEWAAALGGACASSQGQQHFPGVCSVCCGHLTRAPWSPSRVPRIQNNGQRRTQTSPHAGRKGLGHATGGRELGELWIWGKGDNRQEWTF